MGLETLALRGRKARNARLAAGVFVWVCAALLSGCASLWPQTAQLREGLPPGLPERVELTQVPFFPQNEYQCGPAALATVLASSGVKVTPEDLVPEVYLPERKGSLQIEMMAAARRHGMVSYQLAPRYEDVLRELSAGKTVSQIAGELSLSVKTISTYRTRLLEKMHMTSTAELMHYAIANHLVK